MIIEDQEQAEFYLKHLNYYRLGAYWLPFETDHSTHKFQAGTSFSKVLSHYIFDRELRLLVLDGIERFEVSVRSQWAYWMAHHHGPHAHSNPDLALNANHWKDNLAKVKKDVGYSKEAFIRHLREKYEEDLPPVWAICEVMTLGQLSRWYANLKPMPTRRAIADIYGLDQGVLQSWLQHMTHIRNICAHHSRLWNREFTIIPALPRKKPADLAEQMVADSRKLYNTLVILLFCVDQIAPNHHLRERVKKLLQDHDIQENAMGFPDGWKELPIWQ